MRSPLAKEESFLRVGSRENLEARLGQGFREQFQAAQIIVDDEQ